jgi:membrane protease YdiL (CAAX protease family)
MDFKFNELKMDWKVAATIVVSTLLIVIDHYNALFPEKWMDHAFLYMVIPVVWIKIIYRQPLAQFGFRWGDWKAGIIFTLGGWALMTVIMIYVAPTPEFQAYYTRNQDDPLRLISTVAFDLIGWEFVFRGWLLFTLLPICGPSALILQAVPFTIAHFGKPQLETISCIFGGPVYGYIAWRTRSFVYPFAIHWYLTTITILLSRIPF